MLALRKTLAASGVELMDVPELKLRSPQDVIVAVQAAGICGSDLHIDKWIPDYEFLIPALPVTLGHEFSGTIVEAGRALNQDIVGQRVVVKPSVPCGDCRACKEGDSDDCRQRTPIGLLQDGAFASHVHAPFSQCIAIPDDLDHVAAALAEPLTIAEHAVQDGDVTKGSRVVVFGPGTIGQGAALLSRIAGAAEVVIVGYNDGERFKILRSMGFETLVDLADNSAVERINSLAGDGFDAAIEASGSASALNLGLSVLRPRGVAVAVGIHGQKVDIDINQVVRRRLQIRGSYRASHAIWTRVIRLLNENTEMFRKMITHQLSLGDALTGFELGHKREASKVILVPGE